MGQGKWDKANWTRQGGHVKKDKSSGACQGNKARGTKQEGHVKLRVECKLGYIKWDEARGTRQGGTWQGGHVKGDMARRRSQVGHVKGNKARGAKQEGHAKLKVECMIGMRTCQERPEIMTHDQ